MICIPGQQLISLMVVDGSVVVVVAVKLLCARFDFRQTNIHCLEVQRHSSHALVFVRRALSAEHTINELCLSMYTDLY